MPELPEVESWRELSQEHVMGRTIQSVYAAQDAIVFQGVTPARFARALRGRRVQGARRKGKLLWWEMDRRPWPLFHFGMTGSFRILEPDEPRPLFVKAEFTLEGGGRLVMINKRRLGRIRLLDNPPEEPPVSELGLDPFLTPPTAKQLRDILGRRRAPVKAVLLNQHVFAGVGNWIADEVLYQAKVAPTRPCATLTEVEIKALAKKLGSVVSVAVQRGAYSGNFPRTWLFHRRWDWKPRIAAGEDLRVDTVGGRTSVWDPNRQK
jgi:formamidopyrimidine-DNA glycosylase